MIVDLHCHSNASDGELAPGDLLRRAADRGIDMLSVTDHDTVAAYAQIREVDDGPRVIPGVEFSAQWRGHTIHVVGLGIDPQHEAITAAVEQQTQSRLQRAARIATRLSKLGFDDPLAGAERLAGATPIGRPHFAKYLVESGQVKSIAIAFKKYLGAGKPGDVRLYWPELETVIGWITAAGGVATLAHPAKYRMTNAKLGRLVDEFSDCGGQAIEVVCGLQTPDVTTRLARVAESRGLHASCGSDFHAPGQPWNELGTGGSLPRECRPVWNLFQQFVANG